MDAPHPPPLDYRSPRDDRAAGRSKRAYTSQMAGGLLVYVLACVAWGLTADRLPEGGSTVVGWSLALGLLGGAAWARWKRGWRGFLPGVILGFLLTGLAIGACFAIFARGR